MTMASEHLISSLYTAAALAGVYAGWRVYRRNGSYEGKPWTLLPGWIPLLGHAHQLSSTPELVLKLEEWADEHGPLYTVDLAGDHYVTIGDEATAAELMAHRPYVVQRALAIAEGANSIGAKGAFSAEGEQWKVEHRLVRAALSKKNLNDYLAVFCEMATRLVTKWQQAEIGQPIVIDWDLGNAAADSISKVAMDHDYGFLNNPGSQMAKDVQFSMTGFVKRGFSSIWYWRVPIIGQYLDGRGWAINRVYRTINAAVEDYEKRGPSTHKATFLHKVYEKMQAEKSTLARSRLVGNVTTLYVAGTDTTSRTLATALYFLAKDTVLQAELREEADAFTLKSASLDDLFQKLPRLKSFLHEVHRWYAVPILSFRTVKDVPLAGSILPAYTNVFVLSRYVAVSKSASDVPAGPNDSLPDAFDPRRWIVQESGKLSCPGPNPKSTSFLTFGYGLRSCPGRNYSEALSLCILVKALQAFEMALKPGHAVPKFVQDATMAPDCEIELILTQRE